MNWIFDNLFSLIAAIVVLTLVLRIRRRIMRSVHSRRIGAYALPVTLKNKVHKRYPHLDDDQLALVMTGLKEYFQLCNVAGKRPVAMPSQVVDVAWHEFILFTRKYQDFCRQSLGRFLHHTPAEAMRSPTQAQEGIKRAWRIACAREGINAKTPATLPLLFAIDQQLAISDGFFYRPDCSALIAAAESRGDSTPYCASHIGCSSGCSGSGGCTSSCSSGDSGCSSGCGGD
ncbi:glycine-rich domain-containing protein [Thalassolituus sp. LLYu03]|uniref:glycine-rich domain-containing protein n=1 Tax=Thalassolituus sp. LLYu03 TaxID=3421656 RepID=UPI003D2C0253